MIPKRRDLDQHVLNDTVLIKSLKSLIRHNKISEAKLARATNIPQPTLHKILAGKTTDPRVSTLKILADYFDLSMDELYSGVNIPRQTFPKLTTQLIPIVSWNECIKKLSFLSDLNTINYNKWIAVDTPNKELFAVVTKPSMEPPFLIGSILIINPHKKPKDGDLVIAHYPNSQEGTVRKLTVDGPNQLLAPIKQNLPSDKLKTDIKIIGVVIQHRYSYE